MRARVTLFGHPVHQMLIVLPLGLFVTAVIFDVIAAVRPAEALALASFWNIVAGIATGLVAAVFGLIDWTNIPANTRAKRLGAYHGLINVVVVTMFAVAAYLRWNTVGHFATTAALVLEVVAFGFAGLAGWMGGELVTRLGIGVQDHAHADAPSSLSGRSITGSATPVDATRVPMGG